MIMSNDQSLYFDKMGNPPFPGSEDAYKTNHYAVIIKDPEKKASLLVMILAEEPDFIPALFNRALVQFRRGILSGQEAVQELLSHKDLLASVPFYSVLIARLMLEIGPVTHAAIRQLLLPNISDPNAVKEIEAGMEQEKYDADYIDPLYHGNGTIGESSSPADPFASLLANLETQAKERIQANEGGKGAEKTVYDPVNAEKTVLDPEVNSGNNADLKNTASAADLDPIAALLAEIEDKARNRIGENSSHQPASGGQDRNQEPFLSLLALLKAKAMNGGQRSAASATVFDPEPNLLDNGMTVYDSEMDVQDAGKTVYDVEPNIPDFVKTVYDDDRNLSGSGKIVNKALNCSKGKILLGTYRIDSDQIDGGMGSVWKVHHTGWDVDLAMKRPQPQLFADETSKDNFIKECQTWIDLGLHPNIVSCYYVREIEGVPTIFSEWMENGSLENRIQDGTLYDGTDAEIQRRLLDIAIQYARGLHYAHESGLIHQDVKPDNLLLSNDWQAKAADFGLARARAQLTVLDGSLTVKDDSGATHMAASGGYTPAYCSMEQMDGKPLTRRTDIYSWAVSVMEMYLGSRPWTNGVVAGMSSRTYLNDPDAKAAMPELLRDLLTRCLDADPEKRPHDFALIEADLQMIYLIVTGSSYPRPEPEAAADTADSLNNRALTYLDLGLPEKAEENWENALKKDPQHSAALYNQCLYLWREGRIEYEELVRRCFSERQMKSGDLSQKTRLREQVLSEEADTRLIEDFSVCHVKEKNYETKLNRREAKLRFSPDGKYLYTAFDSLSCYDAVDFKEKYVNLETLHKTYADLLEVTADGKYLLYHKMYSFLKMGPNKLDFVPEKAELDLVCADASTGKELRVISGHTGKVRSLRLNPDSIHYYAVERPSFNDRVFKRDLETGIVRTAFEDIADISSLWVRDLCLSPDGNLLYGIIGGVIDGSNRKSTLAIWDDATGKLLRTERTDFRMESLRFSPDGKKIYTCGESGFLVWDAGTLRAEIKKVSYPITLKHMWISPDGQHLLTDDDDNHVRLWDLPELRYVRTFFGHTSEITSLDALGDLSRIAACDAEGRVLIWNEKTPVRRAPWELNVVREYAAVISEQKEENLLMDEIRNAIDKEQIDRAISLICRAEDENEPHAYLPLRRQIKGFCPGERISGSYEIASVQITPKDYISGSIAVHPFDENAAVFFEEDDSFIQILSETGDFIQKVELSSKFKEITFEALIPSLTYSPSGKYLAVGGVSSIMVLDPKTGEETIQLAGMDKLGVDEFGDGKYFTQLAFSPDEKTILGLYPDRNKIYLSLWNLSSGELIWRWSVKMTGEEDMFFLPSGQEFAVLGMFEIKIFGIDSGLRTVKIPDASKRACPSADGKTIFIFTETHGVYFLDTASDQVSGPFRPYPEDWDLFKPNDRHLYWIRSCVSPDGKFLASAKENEIKIWEIGQDAPMHAINILEDVDQLAFSADGCLLFALCKTTLHIWALQWELIFPGWTDDTAAAEGIIHEFKNAGRPTDRDGVEMLLRELKNRGMGYIRPDAIRKKLGK